MNPRIKELIKAAGGVAYDDDGNELTVMLVGKNLEKFAELLVRECMACSTWVGKINTNSVEPIHTTHAINQRIKQHFGVKE